MFLIVFFFLSLYENQIKYSPYSICISILPIFHILNLKIRNKHFKSKSIFSAKPWTPKHKRLLPSLNMVSGKKSQKIPVWDLPDVPKGELPPHIQLQRTRVSCTFDAPTHVFTYSPVSSLIFILNFFSIVNLIHVIFFCFGVKDREYTILGCLWGDGSG